MLYGRALAQPPDAPLVVNLVHAASLEFFVVHASGFLMVPWLTRWDTRRRAMYVAALAAGYSVVLGGIAIGVGGWWPLTIFWGLMANRLLGSVLDIPALDDVNALAEPWAGGTTLFVVAACLAGVTGLSRGAILVAGAGYFGLTALSELTDWRWVTRWMKGARQRSR